MCHSAAGWQQVRTPRVGLQAQLPRRAWFPLQRLCRGVVVAPAERFWRRSPPPRHHLSGRLSGLVAA